MPRVTAKLGPHGWLVCNCRLYLPRPVGASGRATRTACSIASTSLRTADIPENPVLDQDARLITAVSTGVQTPPRVVAMPALAAGNDQPQFAEKRAIAFSSHSKPKPGPFAVTVPSTAWCGSARMAPAMSRYSSQWTVGVIASRCALASTKI